MRAALAQALGFHGRLLVEYKDGDTWIVRENFTFCSAHPAVGCVQICDGFETDFASVPRFFWRVLPPTDAHLGKAAVIHDELYRSPAYAITRKQADEVLMEGMKVLGAPAWKRWAVYQAVRLGGGRAFVARRLS